MPDYPFKVRLIKRGDVVFLEELAVTAKGTYFTKDRVKMPGASLEDAAQAVTPEIAQALGVRASLLPQ